MYRISESIISESSAFLSSTDYPISRYPWRVELYPHGKVWNIGAQNVPIQSFAFNLSEKGCMDAKLKLATIDFPVYYGNEVLIYYYGQKRYRGYISTLPDPKGDSLNLNPYSKRLDEITFNTTWSNYSFLEMLSETITDKTSQTNVYYNPSMVTDYNTTYVWGTTASIKYKYEKITKLIDDYINDVDDVYWGVEENGFMFIKKRSTSITYNLYSGANQAFGSVTPKRDYAKIKETRYNVFQKSTVTNENEYIATIPDGTTNYPYTDNEAVVGVKYESLTAPQGLNSTECKDYAYAKITAQKAPANTKINDIDIRRIDLHIGDRVKVWSESERQLLSLINCNTTNNWRGNVTVDTVDYIEGHGSISFASSNLVYYDFQEIQRYLNIEKIVFMMKSDIIDNIMIFSVGENYTGYGMGYYGLGFYGSSTAYGDEIFTTSNNYPVYTKTVNNWNYVELPITQDFRYVGFMTNSTKSATIKIDDIQIYGYFQNTYEGNVVKLSYSIDSENEYLYDAEIGDLDEAANDKLFELEKKIKQLEVNNQE